MTGVELIAKERTRQIEDEGWNAAHDRGHAHDLALAASCYAAPRRDRPVRVVHGQEYTGDFEDIRQFVIPENWPWSPEWWKPTPDDRIRELVKAGALIAAAIDSLQDQNI